MPTITLESKTATRKRIRDLRRNLSQRQRFSAESKIVQSAHQCRHLWFAKRVLSYAPFDGEISPRALTNKLAAPKIYLPKINNYRNRSMLILRADLSITSNRFGIIEPRTGGSPLFANQVDVIFLPLVAFDRHGNRLGMGSGYYDRALKALTHQIGTRPKLIGLAHWFQEVTTIDTQSWDVPLDAILTDREYIPVASRR